MIVITPDYYKNFKCTANKCKHNCCIGWEIDIDDKTLEKYNNLKGDFANRFKKDIVFGNTPHFRLTIDERCPFLSENGLCDIIANLGEDMLCQICSDHPRFRNYYNDFTELGLGLACEAAAEIILTKKEKTALDLPQEFLRLPLLTLRERFFNLLQDRSLPIDMRVDNILDMVDARLPDIDWYNTFVNLEKLDCKWDEYLLKIKDGIDKVPIDNSLDTAYEQLLVYLIFRHFSDCQYDGRIKERVLYAALIYKVIRTMNVSNTIEELLDIARVYSCEIEYSDENIDDILSLLA